MISFLKTFVEIIRAVSQACTSSKFKYLLNLEFAILPVLATAEVINLLFLYLFVEMLSGSSAKNFSLIESNAFVSSFFKENLDIKITVLFIVSLLLTTFLRVINLYLSSKLPAEVGNFLSSQLLEKILCMPYWWHLQNHSSNILNSIIKQTDHLVLYFYSSLQILYSAFVLLGVVCGMLTISPGFTLVSLGYLSVTYFLCYQFNKPLLAKASGIVSKYAGYQIKSINDSLRIISDVKLLSLQDQRVSDFKQVDSRLRLENANIQIYSYLPKFIIELISFVTIAVYAFFVVITNNNLEPNVGFLVVFLFSFQKLLPAIQQIFGSLNTIKVYQASARSVLMKINKYSNAFSDGCYANVNLICENLDNVILSRVIVDNVTYCLDEPRMAISIPNLELFPGKPLGVVGKSGCGKSTFLKLLAGLLEPSTGSITVEFCIDGKNYSVSDPSFLRQVSYLFLQHPNLVNSSIAYNVSFNNNLSEKQSQHLRRSLALAHCDEFVSKYPNLFYSDVGENGSSLSGGQAHRLAIARSFYHQRPIMLYDEPTSALDSYSQSVLLQNIAKTKSSKIIVITAHRHESLYFCDKVIDLTSES